MELYLILRIIFGIGVLIATYAIIRNLDIIKAKAQAREPGVQDIGGTSMPTPTPKSAAQAYAAAIQKPSAMNEELMSFARMLYGTGLKL